MHTLTVANGQQDMSIEHIAKVLQMLWRQVERLERRVTIGHNWITLKTGDASIMLKADGSVNIRGTEAFERSQGDGIKLATQFQEELRLLSTKYGWTAVGYGRSECSWARHRTTH